MITYEEFRQRTSFNKSELLAMAYGRLIEDPPAGFANRLPMPPMLVFDRIVEISRHRHRGRIVAEMDVNIDAWYFQCHFRSDPVKPGCLGLDAVWQLLGLFCAWSGAVGSGRALGCKEVEFEGQIRPHDRLVRYEVDVIRFTLLEESGAAIAVGDGSVVVDDERIYTIKAAKAGVFQDIDYPDYPHPSERSKGGFLER
jgi:3-hydroxyacyl-[acyl-carrier protein] dehydratase/trans-2-decenoyl-[acyl-carrier protein] isomerase